MIIWWLFDSNYLWLFDDYLRNDYLWLFGDYLMVIFVIIWWLFDFRASSKLVGLLHFQKPSHGTVAHLGDVSLSPGHIQAILQPASLTCYLLQKLLFICNNNLVFHGCFDELSALPHSTCSFLLQEVVDPAITQILRVSCTQICLLYTSDAADE